MKAIAINGSHRPGKNTALMLQAVLEELEDKGVETELVELAELNIQHCRSCNKCLRAPKCSIEADDMSKFLAPKLLEAQAIILGSPVYWGNVTTLMKNFMDRSRFMHMTANLLAGKAGGAVTHAGLRNGGQELCQQNMHHFLHAQGLLLADSRDAHGPILNGGPMATMVDSYIDGKVSWKRSVAEDEIAMIQCRNLGKNLLQLMNCTP